MDNCPLCDNLPNKNYRIDSKLIYRIDCNICGEYEVTLTAIKILQSSESPWQSKKYILSEITRNASEEGRLISFGTDNIQQVIDSASIPNSPIEKMDRILLYIQNKTSYAGEIVEINLDNDYPIAFAKNQDEMYFYLKEMCDKLDWLESSSTLGALKYRLTVDGWKRIEEISKEKRDSSQAFVAMWFDNEMDDSWNNGFKKALEETGYKPIRIDKEEFRDKICDKIIAEIRRSGLLVADLTGFRSGVFFEAGFAYGLDIPVIFTCREDNFEKISKHFDTRQYPHIKWKDHNDLKEQLIDTIEATLPNRKKRQFEK